MTSQLATARAPEAPADVMPEPLAKLADPEPVAKLADGMPEPAAKLADALPEPVAKLADAASKIEALRIPHITIHGFCQTPSLISAMEQALADRRMTRATAKLLRGGIMTAIDTYHKETTPNLIIVENRAPVAELFAQLEALANVCVPGTKVIVIGNSNDVSVYRELLFRGVTDYVVAPLDPLAIIALISHAYQESDTSQFGRVLAFVGASGGAGSSTIAHNVATMIARSYGASVILADLDLPFGTAGLGLDINPSETIFQALNDGDRLDDLLLERLLAKHEDNLHVLAAPATLDQSHELAEDAFERVLDVAQANASFVVVDVPRVWTPWVRKTLLAADEVIITALPNLASFRNLKNLTEMLTKARVNDAPPKLVLNQIGVPKRAELKPEHFAASLKIQPIACIPFDISVASAGNHGLIIADAAPKSPVIKSVINIAEITTGRKAASRAGMFEQLLNRVWKRQ
jgi:pilus assembly protein CpaE